VFLSSGASSPAPLTVEVGASAVVLAFIVGFRLQ
jgi:hypothetical protein